MGRKTFYRLVGGAARTPLGHVNYVELPEDATDIGAFRKAVFHEIEPSLPPSMCRCSISRSFYFSM